MIELDKETKVNIELAQFDGWSQITTEEVVKSFGSTFISIGISPYSEDSKLEVIPNYVRSLDWQHNLIHKMDDSQLDYYMTLLFVKYSKWDFEKTNYTEEELCELSRNFEKKLLKLSAWDRAMLIHSTFTNCPSKEIVQSSPESKSI